MKFRRGENKEQTPTQRFGFIDVTETENFKINTLVLERSDSVQTVRSDDTLNTHTHTHVHEDKRH